MILIGSKAIKYHVPAWREPLDTDLVGIYEEAEEYQKKHRPKVCYPQNSGDSIYMKASSGEITECEIAWNGSRAEKLIDFVQEDTETVEVGDFLVPSLDVLYMLKMSHRYKKDSPWFKKTMDDIIVLRKLGCKIQPRHQEFYEQRQRDTYLNKLPSLNQSKAGFFDSSTTGVVQIYDHDSVHWAVKRLSKPAYEFFKKDKAEVMCSQELFERCSMEVKLLSVVEESMTLAIERSLSVFPGAMTPRKAFEYALSKCATSIASGYWREFAWENYYSVLDLYDDTYYTRFMEEVSAGRVKFK